MKGIQKRRIFELTFVLTAILYICAIHSVSATSSQIVNTKIQLSVCGNNTAEYEEDCDNGDLRSQNCIMLGYASGFLGCNINCSFDVRACAVPAVTPTNVAATEIKSLLPAGLLTVPSTASIISTPSLTTSDQLIIKVPSSLGQDRLVLPDNLVITKTDGANFDPGDLSAEDILITSLSGFSGNKSANGAVQFGISGTTLEFSTPISISLFVGTVLNGQTLSIVRSSSLSSGWTSEGIVSPATCVVADGNCTFQAVKASYFVALKTDSVATTTTTETTTTNSTSNGNSQTNETNTVKSTLMVTPNQTKIPNVLRNFLEYLNGEGKIRTGELYNVIKNWVGEWRRIDSLAEGGKCDVNGDSICDIKDLSVLLFYFEKGT